MCTNKTEISLGFTPLTRDAWETVAGLILFNFSLASKDIDFKTE
jgi:hypothetical protein